VNCIRQSHCNNSPGSFAECRIAPRVAANPQQSRPSRPTNSSHKSLLYYCRSAVRCT